MRSAIAKPSPDLDHPMRLPLRVHRLLRWPAFRINHALGRYEPVVWLIGEGRSGTTWVANLINVDGRSRELFEPVHPRYNPAFAHLPYHAYRAPDANDPELEAKLRQVMTGRMTHWWIDKTNRRLIYRGLIVKDIYASLLAAWAVARLPWVRPIVLIRHPFAVAHSKRATMERQRFRWPDNIAVLTGQADLMHDHLAPFQTVLEEAQARDDFIICQIALWAAIHHVLFRQFSPDAVRVVFYEDVLTAPAAAMAPLAAFLDDARLAQAPDTTRLHRRRVVSSAEEVMVQRQGGPPSWERHLSAAQLEHGRTILQAFGLDGLYDAGGQPVRQWLSRFPIGDRTAMRAC